MLKGFNKRLKAVEAALSGSSSEQVVVPYTEFDLPAHVTVAGLNEDRRIHAILANGFVVLRGSVLLAETITEIDIPIPTSLNPINDENLPWVGYDASAAGISQNVPVRGYVWNGGDDVFHFYADLPGAQWAIGDALYFSGVYLAAPTA